MKFIFLNVIIFSSFLFSYLLVEDDLIYNSNTYKYYSHDYIKEENLIKSEKKGIWQGEFIDPYMFRKLNK